MLIHQLSQSNDFHPARDFFLGDQIALAGAGANRTGLLPRFGRHQVAFPKGPCSTLARSNGIDCTALALVIKNTVAVGPFFKTPALADRSDAQRSDLTDRLAAKVRDCLDFVIADPDITGWPRATRAAARAAKTQPGLIPGLHLHQRRFVE